MVHTWTAFEDGPLFSQLLSSSQKWKVQIQRSARLIAEAASYPYSKYYHWWYTVDFVKRLLVIRFAIVQQNTIVSISLSL